MLHAVPSALPTAVQVPLLSPTDYASESLAVRRWHEGRRESMAKGNEDRKQLVCGNCTPLLSSLKPRRALRMSTYLLAEKRSRIFTATTILD